MVAFSEVLDALRRDGDGWSLVIPRTWANGRTVFGGLQVALSVRAMRGALTDALGADCPYPASGSAESKSRNKSRTARVVGTRAMHRSANDVRGRT